MARIILAYSYRQKGFCNRKDTGGDVNEPTKTNSHYAVFAHGLCSVGGDVVYADDVGIGGVIVGGEMKWLIVTSVVVEYLIWKVFQ